MFWLARGFYLLIELSFDTNSTPFQKTIQGGEQYPVDMSLFAEYFHWLLNFGREKMFMNNEQREI